MTEPVSMNDRLRGAKSPAKETAASSAPGAENDALAAVALVKQISELLDQLSKLVGKAAPATNPFATTDGTNEQQ